MMSDREIELLAKRLRRCASIVEKSGNGAILIPQESFNERAIGLRMAADEVERWLNVPMEGNRT